MFKKKVVYNHGASTLVKACKVNQKKIKRKQDQLNDYIVSYQLKTKTELPRSRVVEKLEQLFSKRELAYIAQQYSEIIQKGGINQQQQQQKVMVDDPSIM